MELLRSWLPLKGGINMYTSLFDKYMFAGEQYCTIVKCTKWRTVTTMADKLAKVDMGSIRCGVSIQAHGGK